MRAIVCGGYWQQNSIPEPQTSFQLHMVLQGLAEAALAVRRSRPGPARPSGEGQTFLALTARRAPRDSEPWAGLPPPHPAPSPHSWGVAKGQVGVSGYFPKKQSPAARLKNGGETPYFRLVYLSSDSAPGVPATEAGPEPAREITPLCPPQQPRNFFSD